MRVLEASNVNVLLPMGLRLLRDGGVPVSPRGMATLEYPTPVATVYNNPTQRVLFSKKRDANPFFHFMEALWILAGREDVAFLAQFNKQMETYSDDGKRFHAAYGHRLRSCGKDQIENAIRIFQREPDSRQVVLQIWDVNKDLNVKVKDIPCNDMIFLKLRDGALNMTVCCRSNDVLWGAYGANVVQFSTLLEYIAARLKVRVGSYTQISDSFHVYTALPLWAELKNSPYTAIDMYEHGISPGRLVDNPQSFDAELRLFMLGQDWYSWDNKVFPDVARPMMAAWKSHKQGRCGAQYAKHIKHDDWRMACLGWLDRRSDRTGEWGFSTETMKVYKGIE